MSAVKKKAIKKDAEVIDGFEVPVNFLPYSDAPQSESDPSLTPIAVLFQQQRNQLAETLRETQQNTLENSDIIEWINSHRHINGRRWSFDSPGPKMDLGKHDVPSKVLRRPYLNQYLRDTCDDKSAIKCRQSEFTENSLNEALYYACSRPHTHIAHVFPTKEMAFNISNAKVNFAIADSPRINAKCARKAVQRYGFKNKSTYTMHGALSKTAGRGESIDVLLFDEADYFSESVEGVFNQLTSHSSMQLIRRVSTPTVPGVGIDKAVKAGCEFQWYWKCVSCGQEQTFSFPDNLINFFELGSYAPDDPEYMEKINNVYFGCRHCGTYVDRNSDYYCENGIWIPRKPQLVGIRNSYYVNSGMIPWKTGKSVLQIYHKLSSYVSTFYNEEWGVAHVKGESMLTEAEIRACQRNFSLAPAITANMRHIAVGIDQGEKESWVVVMASGYDAQNPRSKSIVGLFVIDDEFLNRHGLMDHASAHSEAERMICEHFRAHVIVCDANGIGADRYKYLLKYFPQKERTWGAFFDTSENLKMRLRQSLLIVPNWQEARKRVTFSKVNALKEIQRDFRQGLIGLPATTPDTARVINLFVAHQQALAIMPRFDVEQQREFETVARLREADHFACALMYADVGFTRLTGFGQMPPGIISRRIN